MVSWDKLRSFLSSRQNCAKGVRTEQHVRVPWLWKMQVSDWYPEFRAWSLAPPHFRQDLPRFRERLGFSCWAFPAWFHHSMSQFWGSASSQPILSKKKKKKFPSNSVLYSLICLSSSDSLLWIINFYMVWLQLSSAAFCLVPSSPCRASQHLACTYCVLCWDWQPFPLLDQLPEAHGPWS